MPTPTALVLGVRIAALVGALLLTGLFLGPFEGLLHIVPLTDKEAHAMAFFGVTVGLFAVAPRWRRTDLALAAFSFGVLIELAQGLTGRGPSWSDLMADGVGVLAAVIPGLTERFRHALRAPPSSRRVSGAASASGLATSNAHAGKSL